MSFDKRYPNRKDWREEYRGSKAIDASCRPGGSCPYCASGRKHKVRKAPAISDWDETIDRKPESADN